MFCNKSLSQKDSFYFTNKFDEKNSKKFYSITNSKIKELNNLKKNFNLSKTSRNKLHRKDFFDNLYNESFINQEKLNYIREENELKMDLNRIPSITKKAKMIKRDPNLFHCRLYPYHKINNNHEKINDISYHEKEKCVKSFNKKRSFSNGNILFNINKNNTNNDNEFLYNNSNSNILSPFNTSKNPYYNLATLKSFNGIENEDSFINIYRTIRNKSKEFYYKTIKENDSQREFNNQNSNNNQGRYFNSQISKEYSLSNSFTFSPKLDKNSIKIAEKLEDPKERLLKKRQKFSTYKKLNKFFNKKTQNSFDEDSMNSQEENSKKKKFSKSFDSAKNINFIEAGKGIKVPSRTIQLYEKALQGIKKKHAKSSEKILNDSLFYRTFSYKPKLFTSNKKPNFLNVENSKKSISQSKKKLRKNYKKI